MKFKHFNAKDRKPKSGIFGLLTPLGGALALRPVYREQFCSLYQAQKGFTLFELLIAMALTAVIGSVMFSSWDLVTRSGGQVQRTVAQRERERIVFNIIDDDLAGLIISEDMENGLPGPSKNHIQPNDNYYAALGIKKESAQKRGETVLLSFASNSTLLPGGSHAGFPVCIEYVLRRENGSSQSLVRRERSNCGVSGEFPWRETILMENMLDMGLELTLIDGSRLEQWKDNDASPRPVAARLFWQSRPGVEEDFIFPLMKKRHEVSWDDKKK